MLTIEERVYTLSYLWKEAEYNFAFWAERSDIDWDAEYKKFLPLVTNAQSDLDFYLLLMRFYALLRDGHTAVTPPFALLEGRSVPFGVTRAEGKFILSAVPSGREELLLSEIAHIQGLPIREYIEKYVYPFYWHELPESLFSCYDCIEASVMFNFGVDEPITVTTDRGELIFKMSEPAETFWAELCVKAPEPLDERFRSESLVISLTKDNIAVIEIFDFYHAEITREFAENIGLLKGCAGYIIDVRGNSGGMGDPPLEIARYFISGKYPVKSEQKTPAHSAKYHALEPYIDRENPDLSDPWQRKIYEVASHTYYENLAENGEKDGYIDFDERETELTSPALILTNHRTACAAEMFVSYFKIMGRAKIVGTTTFGSGAEAMIRELPLGGEMRLATTRGKLIDGSEYVNVGIAPDIPVERTAEDIANGTDRVLIKALELLRKSNRKD